MFFKKVSDVVLKLKATLKLKSDSKPIFRTKRPVPYAALATVESELNRLQQAGVIQPIDYSSWAAPIVMMKKANGKIRLCADFSTGLNDALDIHQYPLPAPDDLFIKLNGGTCFAKLDLADAYLQMDVDEDSKNLLTINTHRAYFNFAAFHLASSQHQQFFNKQWIQCSQDCLKFPPTLMTSLLQAEPQRNFCVT